MESPIHSPVQDSPIFTNGGGNELPSPPHDSSEERVTYRGNPNPHGNPPNPVPNTPYYPDSDPSLSDSSSPESSDSSDDEYYKQRRYEKRDKNKLWSKMSFYEPIKNCAKLTAKLLTATYKSKIIRLKLDKEPLQHRVYLLSFMNSLKIVLSKFSEAYMLLMEYPFVGEEEIPDYNKNSTWNLLHAYIDAHSKILTNECPGYRVQYFSWFKS